MHGTLTFVMNIQVGFVECICQRHILMKSCPRISVFRARYYDLRRGFTRLNLKDKDPTWIYCRYSMEYWSVYHDKMLAHL